MLASRFHSVMIERILAIKPFPRIEFQITIDDLPSCEQKQANALLSPRYAQNTRESFRNEVESLVISLVSRLRYEGGYVFWVTKKHGR